MNKISKVNNLNSLSQSIFKYLNIITPLETGKEKGREEKSKKNGGRKELKIKPTLGARWL